MRTMSRQHIPVRAKNIVLIGFMGVGKTTIGKMVADKLYRDFIDVDIEIERRYNKTIPEIFAQHGEGYFREIERNTVIDICDNKQCNIVSLGGGAFKQEAIREKCLDSCLVLFLDLSWDRWKERMDLLIENRPVLHNKSVDEVQQIFDERQAIYAEHNARVTTDNLNPEEVADYIVEILKLGWELHQPLS